MPAFQNQFIKKIASIVILQIFIITQAAPAFSRPDHAQTLRPIEKIEGKAGPEADLAAELKQGSAAEATGVLVEGVDYKLEGVDGIRMLRNVNVSEPVRLKDHAITIDPRGGILTIGQGALLLDGLRLRGPGVIGAGARVGGYIDGSPQKPFVIGSGATVHGEGVNIGESIIGPGAVINGARLRDAVVTALEISGEVRNASVGTGTIIEAGSVVLAGKVGTNIKLRRYCVIGPFVAIGNNSEHKAVLLLGATDEAGIEFPHEGYLGSFWAVPIDVGVESFTAEYYDRLRQIMRAILFGKVISDEIIEASPISSSGALRKITVEMDGKQIVFEAERINFGGGTKSSDYDGLKGGKYGGSAQAGAVTGATSIPKGPVSLEPHAVVGNLSTAEGQVSRGTIVSGVDNFKAEGYNEPGKGFNLGRGAGTKFAVEMDYLRKLYVSVGVLAEGCRRATDPFTLAGYSAALLAVKGQFDELAPRNAKEIKKGLDASLEKLRAQPGDGVKLAEQEAILQEELLQDIEFMQASVDSDVTPIAEIVNQGVIAEAVREGMVDPAYVWINPTSGAAAAMGNWQEAERYKPVKFSKRPVGYGTDGVRGKVSAENEISYEVMTPAVAYRMGLCAGLLALAENKSQVPIGIDPRPSSRILCEALVQGVRETGVEPVLVGPDGIATTPMIQWIANKGSLTGAAVSISGSHLLREPDPENPGAYIEKNGIKLLDIHGRKIPEEWQRYTDGIINSRDLHATILKIAEVEGIFLGDMLAPAPVILPEPNVTLTAAYIKETSDIATRLLESAGLTQQNPMEVIFDLANGAANGPVQQIIGSIPMFAPVYKNDGPGEAINEGCGAEHVDKEHALPKNITAEEVIGKLGVAYDGDADRVMFFTVDSRTGDFVYLDGDWLASIEAAVLQDALRVLGLGDKLKIGGAQTAYSNLEARRYQNKIGVLFDGGDADTGYVRTGDKYVRDNLEERGVRDEIDIGIGFEPAGHGFLIFNPRAKAYIETVNVTTEQQKKAKGLLQGFIDIQNESGGDGIRHSLAAIAAVEYFRQNIADGQITEPADFDKAEVMYKTPSKAHLKVKVKNPNAVRTRGSVGTKLLQPEGLKDAVTAIFAGLSDDNRWVIRPSGTEDVVRVYVEGPDAEVVQAAADRMAEAITSQPETQAAAGGRVVAVITDSNVIGEQFIRDIAERKGVAISQVTIVNVSGDLTPELMTRVANSTGDADVVLVHVRDNSLRKAIADAAGAMGIGMFVLPDAPEEELRDAAAECL